MRPLLSLLMLLFVGLSFAPPTSAAPTDVDATRFTGRIVSSVDFSAPKGFDSEELRYLLDQEVGRPYNPQRVGRSVELLFRLGQFDDVRVLVQEEEGAVRLTFVLVPSARVRRIVLRGCARLPAARVRSALSLGRMDPYVSQDERRLATEVQTYYQKRGFLDAAVSAKVAPGIGGGVVITLSVEEGRPYRVERIKVPPREIAGFDAPRIARMLSPRLYEGKVFAEDDLRRAVESLLGQYRDAGFVEVKLLSKGRLGRGAIPVNIEVDRDTKTVAISLPIDSGRLVAAEFSVDGVPASALQESRYGRIIDLSGAQRASQAYVDDAARQLERSLWRRGYFHARVSADVVDAAYVPSTLLPPPDRPIASQLRTLSFTVSRGPQVVLSRADFTSSGSSFLSEGDLLGVLQDASPSVLGHRPLLATLIGLPIYRRFYTAGELEEALSVLADYYRARGYLDVQLNAAADVPNEGDLRGRKATLHLEVAEGTRTKVESLAIDFELAVGAAKQEQWRRRVEGKPFNPSSLADLVRESREALAESGYIDAKVEATKEFSEDRTLVRLRLKAQRGAIARFGQILVRESRNTHVELIRREVAAQTSASIRAGDVYRPSTLATAQSRLLRTGLFDGVVLRPAQTTGRVRDVEILVNERKRFSFTAGAGLTWPDDGPRVSGEARLRNLDGRGLSVFLRGRLGLDWRYLNAETVRGEYRASIGVELPYVPGVPLRGTVSGILNEEIDEPTYRVRRSEVGASLVWRGSENVGLEARALLQFRTPLRVDSVAQLSLPADLPIPKPGPTDVQLLPLLGVSVSLDYRDDRLNPRKGVYADLHFESTPGQVHVDYPAFGRLTSRVVGLIPFGRGEFGLRLEAGGGVAWSYDGRLPPVESRFRLGGTGTLRGFARDAVGPTGDRPGVLESVGLLSGQGAGGRNVPVGGNAFYRYSIELEMPVVFLSSWRFVVFHDAGNALIYGDIPEGIDASRNPVLHTSVGIGLRRITPIGPLRFDVAVRPARLIEGVANYTVGEVVQVHFAVGAL
jgi:outer membrane protein assembly factor BamA